MKELVNGRSKTVYCDPKALKRIFAKKGLNPGKVAVDIGYQSGYFSKVFKRGKIGITCVELLRKNYGIRPKDYNVDYIGMYATPKKKVAIDQLESDADILCESVNPEVMKTDVVTVTLHIDTQVLADMVKQAVKEAFNEI